MGSSRLPQIKGSHFVQIHSWAVATVGLAGAAVIGELDLRDRNQKRPCQCVATRIDLIASLQGVVGRDAIDYALRKLEKIGWIIKVVKQLNRNPAEKFHFVLNAKIINEYFETQVLNVEFRKTQSGKQDEIPSMNQEDTIKEKEEHKEQPPSFEAQDSDGGGFSDLIQIDGSSQNVKLHTLTSNLSENKSENFVVELDMLITELNLDMATAKRLRIKLIKLTKIQQENLLIVLRKGLHKANDPVGYIMNLSNYAAEGTLSIDFSGQKGDNSDCQMNVSKFLTGEEIDMHLKGKKAVLKDGVQIATVLAGSLFNERGIFSIERTTNIIRAVQSGRLTLS